MGGGGGVRLQAAAPRIFQIAIFGTKSMWYLGKPLDFRASNRIKYSGKLTSAPWTKLVPYAYYACRAYNSTVHGGPPGGGGHFRIKGDGGRAAGQGMILRSSILAQGILWPSCGHQY